MKSVFFFALQAILVTAVLAKDPVSVEDSAIQNSKYNAEQKKIATQLVRTIIPSYQVVNVTLQEAIAQILEKAKAVDPKSKPVRITIDPDFLRSPSSPVDGQAPPQLITLHMTNVREGDLIGYVSRLAGLNVRIKNDGVVLEGCKIEDAMSLLVRKRYSLPAKFFKENGTTDEKCHALLENMGLQFPAGASVHYDAAKGTLTMINTQVTLDLMDQVVELWRKQGHL